MKVFLLSITKLLFLLGSSPFLLFMVMDLGATEALPPPPAGTSLGNEDVSGVGGEELHRPKNLRGLSLFDDVANNYGSPPTISPSASPAPTTGIAPFGAENYIWPSASPSAAPTAAIPGYWETITEDDFESGWGNFKEDENHGDGADAKRIDETFGNQQKWVTQGYGAIRLRDNKGKGSSMFHKANHDVTGALRLRVSFWFSARSMEEGERFVLEYSPDGLTGGSFIEVKEYVYGTPRPQSTDAKYYYPDTNKFYMDSIILNAPNYDLDTTKARIRFRCDASGDGDFVYIDLVSFEAFYPFPESPECLTAEPDGYWETITEDYFESGWGSFKEDENHGDGADAKRINQSFGDQQKWVSQGYGAIRLRDDKGRGSSMFHKDNHDVSGALRLRVSFWYAVREMERGERFVLEYSSDGVTGGSWDVVKEYIYGFPDEYYDNGGWDGLPNAPAENPDILGYAKNDSTHYLLRYKDTFLHDTVILEASDDFILDTTKARIRFRCDASGDSDYVYIDSVHVEGFYPFPDCTD